jgi:hypothetical protein
LSGGLGLACGGAIGTGAETAAIVVIGSILFVASDLGRFEANDL